MTDSNDNALVIHDVQRPAPVAPRSVYSDVAALEAAQRIGNALCASNMVPEHFRGQQNLANVLYALEMANKTGLSVLSVMQGIYIVQGKPSWSSQAMIAMVNGCGRFSALRFDLKGSGNTLSCTAFATEKATGEVLKGPEVTWAMAEAEGWTKKGGSKWRTMPELMARYRAAAFWARLYVPEMLMGYMTQEEVEDIQVARVSTQVDTVSAQIDVASHLKSDAKMPHSEHLGVEVRAGETAETRNPQPKGDSGIDPLD